MASRAGRRRVPVKEENTPQPRQTQRNQRRTDTPGDDEDEDFDMEDARPDNGSGSIQQLSKALVRYALACEKSRKPIKRQDINEKVLGSHTRLFKEVFSSANEQLMDVFAMQFAELPKAEKVTLRQKRAATTDSQSKTTGIWVVQTILPEQYRKSEIIGPSRTLNDDTINKDDAYVGLYTTLIAMITIAGGTLSELKLDRQLRRMEADRHTPIATRDKTLALMIKDGYIVKVRESSGGGEETIDYVVGPRGKVEVGPEGVANFIRAMYGRSLPEEELETAIQRTLDIANANSNSAPAGEAAGATAAQVAGRKRGRPRNGGDDE